MKDEPAVTKFQRIFDRSSLLVKSMFTSFWPRPITYCTKYTQQFLKSMTHTICFLTYYIWREGLPATSEQPWHLCFPLFHLVLMVVSLEDISRLLWVSQDGATSRGVSLCSQWNMFLIGEIVTSLIHLQFSQSFSSECERTKTNLVVGITSWLADLNEGNICRAVLWWYLSWYVTTSASIRSPEAIESCGSGFPY